MDEVARIAREHRPKLLLAGWSAYLRELDFVRFREIADEVGALLMVDMAHFAGLVAAGLHPSPVEAGADVVTTTTHKTLCGPRGGHDPLPGLVCQGDRLGGVPRAAGRSVEHVIAAKAVAFRIAASEGFRGAPAAHNRRCAARSRQSLLEAGHGINVLTGGTDVHLVLVDLRESPSCSGQDAEDRLHAIRITVNRNAVPFDPRPPRVTSGLRIGLARADDARSAGRRGLPSRSARSSAWRSRPPTSRPAAASCSIA